VTCSSPPPVITRGCRHCHDGYPPDGRTSGTDPSPVGGRSSNVVEAPAAFQITSRRARPSADGSKAKAPFWRQIPFPRFYVSMCHNPNRIGLKLRDTCVFY
jgi:hypothetical protein